MSLSQIPLKEIDQSHLLRLIDQKSKQLRTIELKENAYPDCVDGRAELLADVSSLANTGGGDIIIGMTSTDGVPTGLAPLAGDPQQELARLEAWLAGGIEPQIPDVRMRVVPLRDKGAALIIRVPPSRTPPHRVIYNGVNRFWARSSAGKFEPDVEELRGIFSRTRRISDGVRRLRLDRLDRIQSNLTPASLASRRLLVLHVIPHSAFDFGRALSPAVIKEHRASFPPLGRNSVNNWRFNFEGLITLSNADEAATQHHAYVQIFRNGAVEAVSSIGDPVSGVIDFAHLKWLVTRYCRLYCAGLGACGIDPPLSIGVTAMGVNGCQILSDPRESRADMRSINAERLDYVEVSLDTLEFDDHAYRRALRPLWDQIDNTAGRAGSQAYEEYD